jgi:hypothetical protein
MFSSFDKKRPKSRDKELQLKDTVIALSVGRSAAFSTYQCKNKHNNKPFFLT